MSDMKPRRGMRESGAGKVVRLTPTPAAGTVPSPEPMQSTSSGFATYEPVAELSVPPMPPEIPAPADEPTPLHAIQTAVAETIRSVTSAVPPVAAPAEAPEGWGALFEAQSALARGYEQMWSELSGLTRGGIAASGEAAVAMLTARTFSDAIQINTELARRNIEAAVEGSAKLSEIGVKTLSAASRPLLAPFGA